MAINTDESMNPVTGDLADFFKVFGDPTRLRIIETLLRGELCVNDIAEHLGMKQSAISHQLKMLKNARLVVQRREGTTIYYMLTDKHVELIYRTGLEHVGEKMR